MKSVQELLRIKESILQDYLSGLEVKDIAKKYKFKYPRNVYFRLHPLSPETAHTHEKQVKYTVKERSKKCHDEDKEWIRKFKMRPITEGW